MCSIIGFKGKYDKIVLNKIFLNSRIRGLHSFGFAYYDTNNAVQTFKTLDYNTFVNSINEIAPDLFIAHFRYSTSGDYLELSNNQPLIYKNSVFAFNGVISQEKKEIMENQYNIKMPSDNDGYILFDKILKNDKEWLKNNNNITYACVWLSKGELYAKRNINRPLYVSEINKNTIYVSTKDIAKRSGITNYKLLNIC